MNTNTNAVETNDGGISPQRSLWKAPALLAAVIVSALFVASRLVRDWHWHPGAFFVVWTLIFSIGLVYELITWKRDALAYRAAVGIAFVAGFILTWSSFVQMADVTPFAAMYFGVPILGIIAAAIARLRPIGMSRALFVTAFAQACVWVALLAISISQNTEVSSWPAPLLRGFFGNAVLVMMFVGSALLFRASARREPDVRLA